MVKQAEFQKEEEEEEMLFHVLCLFLEPSLDSPPDEERNRVTLQP